MESENVAAAAAAGASGVRTEAVPAAVVSGPSSVVSSSGAVETHVLVTPAALPSVVVSVASTAAPQDAAAVGASAAVASVPVPISKKGESAKPAAASAAPASASASSVPNAKRGDNTPSAAVAEAVMGLDDHSLMYIQSVMVGNIRSHFACLSLFSFLAVSWGSVLLSYLNFFQVAGGVMVLLGVTSVIVTQQRKKLLKRKASGAEHVRTKEMVESTLFSPQDATGNDVMRPGDGIVRRLLRRVKLLPPDEFRAFIAEWQSSAVRALHAARILRFSHPTRFSINISFLTLIFAMVAGYFSGHVILHFLIQSLLWWPVLVTRGVPELVLFKLKKKLGRQFVNFLLVEDYLNLEETNTARVVSFVEAVGKTSADSKPKVVTTPVEQVEKK